MRFRLFALLILPTVALAFLATVVIVDRNNNYNSARTASDAAAVAELVARVDEALGDEALRAANLLGPRSETAETIEAETGPQFVRSALVTDEELDRLEELVESRPYHRDLPEAVATIRQTLRFRSDITGRRVSPLQVNDRYAHIRDLLLDALSTQASVMDDAAGQQRIIGLISLIESRGAHLDERLVVELALSYEQWAPGQHSAAIASVALQDERIEAANTFSERRDLSPPRTLSQWRQQIGISEEVPDLSVAEWVSISDGWLAALNFHIENDESRITASLEDSLDSAASERLATLVGVIVVTVAAMSITAAVAYRLVKRVTIITEQAQRMADGASADRTFPKVGGADELGNLAEAFDEMISQVEIRTNNQLIESTALEAIANRAPLHETLDRISMLLGVDAAGESRYRFVSIDGDRSGAVPSVRVVDNDTPNADDDFSEPLPASTFDSPEYRTAMGLVATAQQRESDQGRLEWQANHDDLTGLLNRGAIIKQIDAVVDHEHPPNGTKRAALIYADLDNFNALNDKFGHGAGDQVLIEQADRLTELMSPLGAIVGRFGGDEFLVVVPEVSSFAALQDLAQRVADALSQPIENPAATFEVGVSLGATLCRSGVDAAQLLDEANSALYEAKRQGRGAAVLSTNELRQQIEAAEQLRLEVADAFDHDQFEAWYQPVWGGGGGRLVGLEALVRWQHPERGMVSPGEFLPVVQDLHLLPELDAVIFAKVCQQTATWLQAGFDIEQVHVNISTERLEVGDFIDDMFDVMTTTSCPPSVMVAEVTETGLMTDTHSNSRRLQVLREKGVRIAVDDFGQGYSSLAYLSELPVDLLKIDRRFVDHIDEVSANQAIASAVIDLGHKLGMTIVAEGIERSEELDYLREVGSELFQGYLLARPMPVPEITALLGRARSPIADAEVTAEKLSLFGDNSKGGN